MSPGDRIGAEHDLEIGHTEYHLHQLRSLRQRARESLQAVSRQIGIMLPIVEIVLKH